MAESLSRLALKDAKQSAESAKQQLKTAKPRSDGSSVSPEDLERADKSSTNSAPGRRLAQENSART